MDSGLIGNSQALTLLLAFICGSAITLYFSGKKTEKKTESLKNEEHQRDIELKNGKVSKTREAKSAKKRAKSSSTKDKVKEAPGNVKNTKNGDQSTKKEGASDNQEEYEMGAAKSGNKTSKKNGKKALANKNDVGVTSENDPKETASVESHTHDVEQSVKKTKKKKKSAKKKLELTNTEADHKDVAPVENSKEAGKDTGGDWILASTKPGSSRDKSKKVQNVSKSSKWDTIRPEETLEDAKSSNNGFAVLRLIPDTTERIKKPSSSRKDTKHKESTTLTKKARENLRRSNRVKEAKEALEEQQKQRREKHMKDLTNLRVQEQFKETRGSSSRGTSAKANGVPSGAHLHNGRLVWD
ncbi:hypothetical protein AX774_g1551 [Zancudomyces culisetae]|uniref:Uncharacterized protein n=1 Tax=Zancudomyces culisetae TaxID=1213189 RepID=A0A1R1PVE3_ZANCU|nr:hypothetical protein AX774_g1551 [Zancudomyces culisetae]|eukprot:OMH84914.1 hypothetical protein AX774_g1551 [Zancudomyces culisetae]